MRLQVRMVAVFVVREFTVVDVVHLNTLLHRVQLSSMPMEVTFLSPSTPSTHILLAKRGTAVRTEASRTEQRCLRRQMSRSPFASVACQVVQSKGVFIQPPPLLAVRKVMEMQDQSKKGVLATHELHESKRLQETIAQNVNRLSCAFVSGLPRAVRKSSYRCVVTKYSKSACMN